MSDKNFLDENKASADSKDKKFELLSDTSSLQNNSVEIPVVNLPKGGGAVRGIEEKFQINAVTGTNSLGIPIPLTNSRHNFVPAIGLHYNSGSGNSSFGLGWNLNIPSITRKTEMGLPQYFDENDSDTFILSGTEDLIPLLEKKNSNWEKYKKNVDENGVSYTVRRYRPRIEGAFSIIEKWRNNSSGETHWRTVSSDNTRSYYGLTPESRVFDPKDESRVFEWKICRTHDDKGNILIYEYKKEDFAGIPNKLNEKNRKNNCTQTYIKKIFYGNREPYYLGDAIPGEDDFLFKVLFDYGEHDNAEDIPKSVDVEQNDWSCRQDTFSDYRAGFEIRTYRRCRRILVFHCFGLPELPHSPYLTNSLQAFYDDDAELVGSGNKIGGFSFLTKVRQNGHLWNEAAETYSTKFLPETEFSYQKHEWDTTVKEVSEPNALQAPAGIDNKKYLWIDLFSEGISGILTEQAEGWFYKSNLGGGNFSNAVSVSPKPNLKGLNEGKTTIQELEGDGVKYLVKHSGIPKGFFKLTDEDRWESFRNFEKYPNLNPLDVNLRSIDVNNDGIVDLLFTEENKINWYQGLGEKGFEVSKTVSKEIDEEKGPAVVFEDRDQSIFLADMNGDGLTDIVRIGNGEICYWANLGYGKFSSKVSMDNAPVFDHQDTFNPAFLRLADVDGSGTTDIVYLGKNDFRVWMNLNGSEWTVEPQVIAPFPDVSGFSDVSVIDFLGTGTACIVCSSSLPQRQNSQIKYIDLMAGKKPHLLNKYENNGGKEVTIEYKSSALFYLEDKAAGRKWATKLPFPVHCVSKVRSEDFIRRTVFTSSYKYSHGYYDHKEREFRGFARVEQLDTEDFSQFKVNNAKNVVEEYLHQPPVKVISWFHTGAFFGKDRILHQLKTEYFQNEEFAEYDLPEPFIGDDLTADELREALRALKGLSLRSEVYSQDNSPLKKNPYSASQSTFEIRKIQPREDNRYASFQVLPSESIVYNYERNPADPRVSHSFVLETDELGDQLKTASVIYPRVERPLTGSTVPDLVWDEQNKLSINYSESLFTDDIIDESKSIYRLRAAYESKNYEVSGIEKPAEFFFTKEVIKSGIEDAAEILFEKDFSGDAEKRLLSHNRIYFINDDLDGELPLGELSALGIGFKSYQLAYTKNLVGKLFGAKVTDAMLIDAEYVHNEGDEHWWTQSGTVIFAANPKDNFYLPIGSKDIFGNESFVEYDSFNLMTETSIDAIGNKTTSVNDYRTLTPKMLIDANLNRSQVETDELGMVVRSAVMGKPGDPDGDTLADPTIRFEYDMFNWKNNRKPNFTHLFAREKHGAANPRWQERYVYSDGGGGVIMTKMQAKPGIAVRWNEATKKLESVAANPRWVGNGRTILNNKGNPIKKFESYFSTTHEFEDEDELVETGISPIYYYDAMSRNIRTEFPNGTFAKAEFDAWHSKSYDVNDTVKDSLWYIERGSPDPDNPTEPTDPEQRAAWLAAKHYDTPQTIHSDLLGNPFYVITDYGKGKTTATYSKRDFSGRFCFAFDQKGRMVAESYTNNLGAVVYSKSAEKGEQWIFNDVFGRLVKVWDNDTREFRTTYDDLHRPISSFLKEGADEYLFSHILYGDYVFDSTTAEDLNMKGRSYRVYDQSGSATIKEVDFKGNTLEMESRLIKDYKARIIDWKDLEGLTDLTAIDIISDALLEDETFSSKSEFDALNRPVTMTVPGGTIYQPEYNEANYLDSLQVKILGTGSFQTFLAEQDYDARGQRQFAKYGNDTLTEYFYDPKNYRLNNILTRLTSADSAAQAIQNIKYTFDPIGNITQIRDDAQQTHFFKNTVVYPENKYVYDAVYQLLEATGREHARLGSNTQTSHLDLPFNTPLPHMNDLKAVREYKEKYQYDDCGNITRMQHIADSANWTRRYQYEYDVDPNDRTNRLKATSDSGDAEGVFSLNYNHDIHGNMTAMPHLSTADSLIWNFLSQLKEVDLGSGGKAFYVYGNGGNRVRKIVERTGGKIKETIYLGKVEIYRERQGTNDPHFERQTIYISDNTGKIAQVDVKTLDDENLDPANPLDTNLTRYQYGNHLGSAVLETNDAGAVISYEEYHPFGTTSYRVFKSAADLSLKRYRFSGKERDDETGFYYFGARYYAAWLGRWISSDPAGFADGFNVFRYCSNNPVKIHDPKGTKGKYISANTKTKVSDDPSFEELKKIPIKEGWIWNPEVTKDNYKDYFDDGIWGIWIKVDGSSPESGGSSEKKGDGGGGKKEGGGGTAKQTDEEAPKGKGGGDAPQGGEAPKTKGSEGGSEEGVEDGSEEGVYPEDDDPTPETGSGEVPDSETVGKPGFAESLIPIWGSGREAIYNFQKGNWGWGIFYTVLAITDVFLVKALVTSVIKGVGKAAVTAVVKEGAEVVAKEGGEAVVKETAEVVAKEGAEAIAKEGGETVVKEGAEAVAKEGAELTVKTGAQVAGKIAYGATDLSKIAQAYRVSKGIKTARNIAVFEYIDKAGVKKTITMASQRNVGHSERLIAKELEKLGIKPENVTRIYSELAPCHVPGGYCAHMIAKKFASAVVTYSFEYGTTKASRQSGVAALKEAVKALF